MSPKATALEIDNYLKYMENIKSASPHTLRAYKKDLSLFFDPVKYSKTNTIDLRNYLSAQLVSLGRLSMATRNRKVGCLKSFLNWMYETRLIDTALSEFYHSPKVPRKMPHFISFDEATSCISFLSKNKQLDIESLQKKLLFLFLYGAGLRISEGCRLKFLDINEPEKKIVVRGKGGKERIVVCPEFVWIEWARYVQFLKKRYLSDFRKLEFVFLCKPEDEKSKPISERTGYSWIRAIGAGAGLTQSLNPHALRHSFATHLLNSGANLRVIQSLLGHSTLAATEKYTHLNLTQLYNTMERAHPLGKLKSR